MAIHDGWPLKVREDADSSTIRPLVNVYEVIFCGIDDTCEPLKFLLDLVHRPEDSAQLGI